MCFVTPIVKRVYQCGKYLPSPFVVRGSGIYAIINRNNLKVYIGSAVRISHRWTEHRKSLENGNHHSRYLQRAFEREPDAFVLELIEELPNADQSTLLSREQFWLDFYRSYLPDNGYNIAPKARSCQGIKRSPEMIARISNTLRGRKFSPERIALQRITHKGHKGRKFTQEQREEARRRMLGKKLSPETCQKLSQIKCGRILDKGRKVCQYSHSGEFIQTYNTIAAASRKTGTKECNIRQALDNPSWSPKGFYWRDFIDHELSLRPIKPRVHRTSLLSVEQLNANHEHIATFETLKSAADLFNVRPSALHVALKKQKRCRGFYWRYANV